MNPNLKRRRSSSIDFKAESDHEHEDKRSRLDMEPSDADIKSSPVPKLSNGHELSSQIFNSDTLSQEGSSSLCGCNNCIRGSTSVTDRQDEQSQLKFENLDDLHPLDDLDHGRSDNLEFSPNSQFDDRIHCFETISSPGSESVIHSELFGDDELEDDDDEVEEFVIEPEDHTLIADESEYCPPSQAAAGKAVTFMGQITPCNSLLKSRSETTCSTWTSYRRLSIQNDLYAPEISCPVPQLAWANREKFWRVMCHKDELSLRTRNPDLFDYQEHLKPRMRVILLDWISEVAEVFKLHRETYYLALDYIDRYLSAVENIPKQQLQLIGVTCLVLASKMEEIYPPKIDAFASITDGACTEEEIFSMEVTILKHLNWLLSPITINNWLEMMLQFIYQKLENKNSDLLIPHFSSKLFKRLCELLDLATLDITSLRFSYGILAASAIYILVDPELAISTSGLKKEVLGPCVQWMSVYWKVLKSSNESDMAKVNELLNDDSEGYVSSQHPELKTHSISMQLYDLVQFEFENLVTEKEKAAQNNPLINTPPPSSSKMASSSVFDTPCSSKSIS